MSSSDYLTIRDVARGLGLPETSRDTMKDLYVKLSSVTGLVVMHDKTPWIDVNVLHASADRGLLDGLLDPYRVSAQDEAQAAAAEIDAILDPPEEEPAEEPVASEPQLEEELSHAVAENAGGAEDVAGVEEEARAAGEEEAEDASAESDEEEDALGVSNSALDSLVGPEAPVYRRRKKAPSDLSAPPGRPPGPVGIEKRQRQKDAARLEILMHEYTQAMANFGKALEALSTMAVTTGSIVMEMRERMKALNT